MHPENLIKPYARYLTIILFCLAICFPAAVLLVTPAGVTDLIENRVLASFPPLKLEKKSIKEFPNKFDKYFNDHFGYRDKFIFWHHYLKALVFNTSPVSKVIIGKDGWLYLNENNMIEDYRGLIQYSDGQLLQLRNIVQYRHDLLSTFGIQYFFVIAPNKQTIYPEYLPDNISKIGRGTKLDQLIDYLKNNSTVKIIDLRRPLLEEKLKLQKNEFLYLQKDTHWNQRGAFIAYKYMINAIRYLNPAVNVLHDSEINMSIKKSVRGDLANMLGLKNVLTENAPFLKVYETKSSRDDTHNDFLKLFENRYPEGYRKPFMTKCEKKTFRLAVFRDSFFTDIIPYVSESFNHIIYFYEPYNEQIMAQLFYRQLKPDIVIEEIIERGL